MTKNKTTILFAIYVLISVLTGCSSNCTRVSQVESEVQKLALRLGRGDVEDFDISDAVLRHEIHYSDLKTAFIDLRAQQEGIVILLGSMMLNNSDAIERARCRDYMKILYKVSDEFLKGKIEFYLKKADKSVVSDNSKQ